jgi:hypothetical protein
VSDLRERLKETEVKHKFWGYVTLAFVVFFIVKNPTGAALTAQHLGAGLAGAATSVGNFFTAVSGGAR